MTTEHATVLYTTLHALWCKYQCTRHSSEILRVLQDPNRQGLHADETRVVLMLQDLSARHFQQNPRLTFLQRVCSPLLAPTD